MPVVYSGSVDGKAFYVSDKSKLPAAENYLKFLNVKNKSNKLFETENVDVIKSCSLPTIRFGRMMQLKEKVNSFRLELLEVLIKGILEPDSQHEAEKLLKFLEDMERTAGRWLKQNPLDNLPVTVDDTVPGWTAGQLLKVYKPLYPKAREIKNPNRMITLYEKYLRRVRNEEFVSRFEEKGLKACEFLFDKTDALIHAGIKWGGNNVRFYSLTAKHELGMLRNAEFVLPALYSSDYEIRRTAVICLAFLQNKETYNEIFRIAVEDKIEEVRRTAVWVYAFCKGEGLNELLEVEGNKELKEFLEIEGWNRIWFV